MSVSSVYLPLQQIKKRRGFVACPRPSCSFFQPTLSPYDASFFRKRSSITTMTLCLSLLPSFHLPNKYPNDDLFLQCADSNAFNTLFMAPYFSPKILHIGYPCPEPFAIRKTASPVMISRRAGLRAPKTYAIGKILLLSLSSKCIT